MEKNKLEIKADGFRTRLQLAFYILVFGKISIDGTTVLEALGIGLDNLERFDIDKEKFERMYG